MEIRGVSFAPVIDAPGLPGTPSTVFMTESVTIEGRTASRRRCSRRIGAGVMVSDARVRAQSLSEFLKEDGFQTQERPFFLSFRATGDSPSERMTKTREALSLVQDALSGVSVTFALVPDFSLLSLEDPASFSKEVLESLAVFGALGIPVVPEVSVLCPPETASEILMNEHADALFVSGSIAWADLPERVRKVFFRSSVSPLASIGDGRVSGKYLLPLTVEWIRQLKRQLAFKPILAGGGVLRPKDVDALKEAGASAVALGDARKLRPWNVGRIVRRAYSVFKK